MAEQAEQANQVLAAFVFESGEASRRFLKTVQEIDKVDDNVQIVDAAIADRTKLGRVKIHQTEDRGGAKGAARGGTIGVVVGAILLGPAGAVVGGAAGGLLAGLHNRFHDIGVDDKFMREVAKEMEKGRSALFVLYEGDWSASIGLIETAVKNEGALLVQSTLPAETATALLTLVAPAVEGLGGEEVVADYEVAIEAGAEAAAAPAAEEVDDLTRILGVEPDSAAVLQAAGVASYARLASTSEPDLRRILGDAGTAVPKNVNTWAMQASFAANGDWAGLDAFVEESQAEPTVAAVASTAGSDDLTQLAGIGAKSAKALTAAGIATYASLAEANEPQVRKALLEAGMLPPGDVGTWPSQAAYAAKGDWQGLTKYNEKRGTRKPKAAAATPSSAPAVTDDLTQLSGIGPRMSSVLAEGGVTSYDGLQHTSTDELRRIVSAGGVLPPSSLETWPTQASYASKGDWRGLTEYNKRHRG